MAYIVEMADGWLVKDTKQSTEPFLMRSLTGGAES
jgi:hypothetical protein